MKTELLQQFLRSLFTWRGRINRSVFCFCFLGFIVLSIALNYIGQFLAANIDPSLGVTIYYLVSLALMLAMLFQMMRRYHDFGVTGWVPGGFFLFSCVVYTLISPTFSFGASLSVETNYYIRLSVQILGYIVMLFVPALVRGHKSANKYGAPPQPLFATNKDGGKPNEE